jgi:hypothetical protein
MPHEECVNLIKRAGDTLALKVVTANISSMTQSQYQHLNEQNISSQSLPYRRKGKFIFSRKKKQRKFVFIFKPHFDQVLNNNLMVCIIE